MSDYQRKVYKVMHRLNQMKCLSVRSRASLCLCPFSIIEKCMKLSLKFIVYIFAYVQQLLIEFENILFEGIVVITFSLLYYRKVHKIMHKIELNCLRMLLVIGSRSLLSLGNIPLKEGDIISVFVLFPLFSLKKSIYLCI